MDQRGFGLIEILIVVVVIALGGYYFLMQYVGSSARSVEVRAYQAEKGQWPPDKATVAGLLNAPPRRQYDPASGTLALTVDDDARC